MLYREFSYESIGEIILKIGPHLPKLLSNIKGYIYFFETQCTVFVVMLAMPELLFMYIQVGGG